MLESRDRNFVSVAGVRSRSNEFGRVFGLGFGLSSKRSVWVSRIRSPSRRSGLVSHHRRQYRRYRSGTPAAVELPTNLSEAGNASGGALHAGRSRDVTAAVHGGRLAGDGGGRYSHADHLFRAAHIFHLLSIVILGIFVVEVRNEPRRCTEHLYHHQLLID